MNPNDFDVVYTYTRKQAIEDGVLIDITDTAKEMGFKFPVAITSTVWHGYIIPPKELKCWGQSEKGRLWDVIFLLYFRISQSLPKHSLHFITVFMMPDKRHDYILEFHKNMHFAVEI